MGGRRRTDSRWVELVGVICLTGVGVVWYYDVVFLLGKIGCPNEGDWIVAERRAGGSYYVVRNIEIGSGSGVGFGFVGGDGS